MLPRLEVDITIYGLVMSSGQFSTLPDSFCLFRIARLYCWTFV